MNDKDSRAALVLSIEVVLMRKGGPQYHQVLARLERDYECKIFDCYEHPEFLKAVLQEVYPDDYQTIIDDLIVELDEMVTQKEIAEFLSLLK
jgi:hypothetical protein